MFLSKKRPFLTEAREELAFAEASSAARSVAKARDWIFMEENRILAWCGALRQNHATNFRRV